MAELAKKLHFLKNGTEQTAKAYSTTGEAGSSYIPSKIDGVACYIPIGSISDVMATNGRVIKSGTTYAIKSQAKPAYAEQSWTTPGTYTWTCPSGVSKIRVAVCGGGGGGASGFFAEEVTANKGGSSGFGNLISATGGNGGYVRVKGSQAVTTEGAGGSPNGRAGTAGHNSAAVPGGTGFALSFNLTNGSYGNGGASSSSYKRSRAGGGSGGYDSSYVNVSPNQSYTVVVGAGGNGNNGDSGKSGFVLIAYGGDI